MSNFQNYNAAENQTKFTQSMAQILAIDMNEVLSKYILDCLAWGYYQNISVQYKNTFLSNTKTSCLTLNQLALQRKSNLIVPKPRYASTCSEASKDEHWERTESLSVHREEQQEATSGNCISSNTCWKIAENQTFAKPTKKTKQQLKMIKLGLAFDNETGDLATRCDVVYKTILRDFRRFFLDDHKYRKHQSQTPLDMHQSLKSMAIALFADKSTEECVTIALDLGCLLFPKEMTKDKSSLSEIERTRHFGLETHDNKIYEIMRIHGFLYKFSIDKIQECFQNHSLCKLFLLYVEQTRDTRIRANPTMNKNSRIYLKARDILEEKAAQSLSE